MSPPPSVSIALYTMCNNIIYSYYWTYNLASHVCLHRMLSTNWWRPWTEWMDVKKSKNRSADFSPGAWAKRYNGWLERGWGLEATRPQQCIGSSAVARAIVSGTAGAFSCCFCSPSICFVTEYYRTRSAHTGPAKARARVFRGPESWRVYAAAEWWRTETVRGPGRVYGTKEKQKYWCYFNICSGPQSGGDALLAWRRLRRPVVVV